MPPDESDENETQHNASQLTIKSILSRSKDKSINSLGSNNQKLDKLIMTKGLNIDQSQYQYLQVSM